jgi:transposase
MADEETWARRVAEWKASGLSSPAFCEGKSFSAGGLRHMAHRLSHGRRQDRPSVRVARVVRVSEPRSSHDERSSAGAAAELVLDVGAARIAVRPGFDRATLAAVLEVFATGRSAR